MRKPALLSSLLRSSLVQSADEILAALYLHLVDRRKSDVALCSFPKSGRTWLRFMISTYQLLLYDIPFSLDLLNFARISPNLGLIGQMGLRGMLPDRRVVRVIGTHSHQPHLLWRLRLLYLTRDPRDVLVSYYHYLRARNQYSGSLEEFVWSSRGLAGYVRYHNRWYRALQRQEAGSVLKLRYEDLKTDCFGCLERCLSFLGLPIDSDLAMRSIEYSSAENMKKLEERSGSYDFSSEEVNKSPQSRQVRRAMVGGYRDEISAAILWKVEEMLRENLLDKDCLNL